MSKKIAFTLLVLTTLVSIGAQPTGCFSLPAVQVNSLINNSLATRLSAGSSTIYTGRWVTFTATVTDEWLANRFVVDQYEWSVDGSLAARTASNQTDLSFDVAGRHYVEVAVQGSRAWEEPLTDYAALNVNVEDDPTGSSSSDPTGSTDTETLTVSISGPDELMTGQTGTYSVSAGSAGVDFTWDLLGDAAEIDSTTGSVTSVTGVATGDVTLIAEARDSEFGNVLATAQKTIGIQQEQEYVVWYTGNVCCWGAPHVLITTRSSFEEESPRSGFAGGGLDSSILAIKIEMQGGFSTFDEATAWLCPQIDSRFNHYWCGNNYAQMNGKNWQIGLCDTSDLPFTDDAPDTDLCE